jgi:hypothetical protein
MPSGQKDAMLQIESIEEINMLPQLPLTTPDLSQEMCDNLSFHPATASLDLSVARLATVATAPRPFYARLDGVSSMPTLRNVAVVVMVDMLIYFSRA